MKTLEKARVETRLSKEQKIFFKHAAYLGGYRTLTEFIINSAQERATKIVEEYNKVISSRKDQDIFFNELMNPSKPNRALKSAASRYKKMINE